MKPVLIATLVLLLTAGPAVAQQRSLALPQPPTIDFLAAPKVTAQMIVDSLRRRIHGPSGEDQAFGYLRGVKDSIAGKWCRKAAYSNLEVDGEVIGYLAELAPAARQGEAAPLIADFLQAKFPCPKRKER